MKPEIIKGSLSVDDRGQLSYVNDFKFRGVKRFYTVENHRQGFIRAWHGHKQETKYVLVVKGAILIGTVKIDDWDNPSPDLKIAAFALSENEPSILYIPKGYANGFKTLTANAKVMFFSTSTLEESKLDDYRYNARYWNIWGEAER